MGKLLRVICCAAFVGLLASNLSAAGITVFSDDFESGNLNPWTVAPSPATTLDISTAQNRIPVGGSYSALMNNSLDKMYHNLGSEASGHLLFTSWQYFEDPATRAFAEMRAYGGAGYADGTLQQVLAIGKYSSVTMAGEVYDGTKYQGRILYPTASMGWFNLNAPGAPSRSAGWHQFDIEVMPSGVVNFYVDNILSRSISGATAVTYDSVTIGSIAGGSTAANAWFDGVSMTIVPEPGSVALLVSGLVALVGLALVRARRRSA